MVLKRCREVSVNESLPASSSGWVFVAAVAESWQQEEHRGRNIMTRLMVLVSGPEPFMPNVLLLSDHKTHCVTVCVSSSRDGWHIKFTTIDHKCLSVCLKYLGHCLSFSLTSVTAQKRFITQLLHVSNLFFLSQQGQWQWRLWEFPFWSWWTLEPLSSLHEQNQVTGSSWGKVSCPMTKGLVVQILLHSSQSLGKTLKPHCVIWRWVNVGWWSEGIDCNTSIS